MRKGIFILFYFCLTLVAVKAQNDCTPHDHPSNEIRSKGFMDAGGQMIANDFVISANTLNFLPNQMEVNLWTEEGEIDSLDIIFYDNDGGDPGSVVGEIMGVIPTSQEIIDMDEVDNFEIRKVILDFAADFSLEGTGTAPVRYWVQLVAYPSNPEKRVGWELNGVEVDGEGVKFSNPTIDYWMTNDTWDGVFAIRGICTATEGCHIPEAVNVTDIQTQKATVVWNGVEDAGQYILEYGLHGFEPGTGEGTVLEMDGDTTGVILTDLEMVTQYDIYMKTICIDEGESIYTVPLTFSTIDEYCMIGNLAIIEPITYVEFAGIENRSPAELDASPAHEYFLDIQAEVIPGQTYQIVIEGNTGGNYEDGVTVFFDWNQDGEFNNTTERYDIGILFNSNGEDDHQISAEILVPEDAVSGVTRMRVMKEFYANTFIPDGCYWISYGQAEDYTVAVGSLGLNVIDEKTVKLYPNPVIDVLNVESAKTVSSVEIYSLAGQLVMKKNLNAVKGEINVSNLPSGIFIIKLNTGDSVENYKIIKK